VNLRDYLEFLKTRKLLILATTVLCSAAALAVSLATVPTYQASAKLLVVARSEPRGGVGTAYEGALLSQQLVKSFAEVLQSRRTAEAALRQNPEPFTASELQSRVRAEPILDTLLINLSVQDADPARAQRIANSVAQAFIATAVPTLQGESALQVSLVEPALKPAAPIKPRTKLNIALGALLGFLLGVGFAFLAQQLDISLKTPEALEAAAHAPVLGTIPVFDTSKDPLSVAKQPRSPEAEAFRKLRTNFAFLGVDQQSICCVITSPNASEGKSVVTANLGLALAQAGQRVVIVDADLRKPSVHQMFDLQQRVGTTTILLGRAMAEDALQPYDSESLSVLTSGPLPPNPSELLGSHQMSELVTSLKERADVILFDCPPTLPVTDPMVVSRFADGVLLVGRADATTKDQIAVARAACDKAGARVFGVVLNATPLAEGRQPAYYAYYGAERPDPSLNGALVAAVPGRAANRRARQRLTGKRR
jgi:capsular exopolysaccharide synthesis family protein